MDMVAIRTFRPVGFGIGGDGVNQKASPKYYGHLECIEQEMERFVYHPSKDNQERHPEQGELYA
jgi:hypothetical protein